MHSDLKRTRARPRVGRILAGILLGSITPGLWQGFCIEVLGIIRPSDWSRVGAGGSLLYGAIMAVPTACVFIVVGLPLYAIGRAIRCANAFTAAGLGFLLGLLSFAGYGFTLRSSPDEWYFAVAVMGWSGALAGLVFWFVVEGFPRRRVS